MIHALSCHLLIELNGCSPGLLNDSNYIETALTEASRLARTTIVSKSFHTFSPQGVSGALVIAESHISIHTWPEIGYAALDIFTCGDRALPMEGAEYIINAFAPEQSSVLRVERGLFDEKAALRPPQIVYNASYANQEISHDSAPAVARQLAH